MEVKDFDRPIEGGYRVNWLQMRWRLEKLDPDASLSQPNQPLVVYLEQGIPGRYRTAIRDGILYWSRALEAAGFRDAIQVHDLPPDASPLDYRFPIVVIWSPQENSSIGIMTSDPRTGQAVKGVIALGSTGPPLRSYAEYTAVRAALGSETPPYSEFLLQKIRWLAAHEFGHILGMTHNFASPSMVAPSEPWLRVGEQGRLIAEPERIFSSDPFPYDRWVMRFQNTPFASEGQEEAGLAGIVEEGLADGLRYVNVSGLGLSPLAAEGAQGENPLEVLDRESAVRRVLLANFGDEVLDPGDPPELLFERLIPVYFHHRFGLGAVGSAVCGLDFRHAHQGDAQAPPRPLDSSLQDRALDALIAALTPSELSVPESVISLIPPRHPSLRPFELEWPADGQVFFPTPAFVGIGDNPDDGFYPLAWAEALARLVVNPLLASDRLKRCIIQHARDPDLPSAVQVIDRVVEGTWGVPTPQEPMAAALGMVAQRAVLDQLLALLEESTRDAEVRAAVVGALGGLEAGLSDRVGVGGPEEKAHLNLALRDIRQVLKGPSG